MTPDEIAERRRAQAERDRIARVRRWEEEMGDDAEEAEADYYETLRSLRATGE